MERRFRFGPHPQAGWILGLRGSQLAGIVVAGIVALALMRMGGPLAIALVAADFALALVVVGVRFAGHTSLEWIPVVARFSANRFEGSTIFRSRSPGWGGWVELPKEPSVTPKPVETVISLPAELSDLVVLETPLYAHGGILMGVVKDKRERTYTATVRCSARAFYLLGEEERASLLASYGALLTQFASDDSPVRRIGWYERTTPSGRSELQEYLRDNARAGIADDDPGLIATQQLLAAQGQELDHEVLVSLQISAGRGRRSIGHLGGGDEGALALMAEQVAKLVDELTRIGATHTQPVGARNPAVPNARQLAGIIRDGIDPFTRHEREQAPAGAEQGIPPGELGPQARDVAWSHVRADRSLHVTGHLLEFPRHDVRAQFLQGVLMGQQATRTVALVMHVMGPRKAVRQAERQAEEASAEGWLRNRIGRRTSARDRARAEHVATREEELARGHALVQFAGYVTVTVPETAGIPALDSAFGRVQSQALAVGLRLERMHGEQQEALTYTLPLCRGLL